MKKLVVRLDQSLWGSRSSQCSHWTVSHIFENRGRLRIGTIGVVLRLGDVPQFGFWTLAFGRLSLSRWTPLVQVELDRKQFFAIELDFKIVLRDRALMPGRLALELDPRRVCPNRLFLQSGR